MNALFGLAADFFEHMTNSAYGRDTNDGYGLRFQVLMDQDETLATQLANAELGADDVRNMSLGAWLWYLRWRAPLSEHPVSGEFLDALYDEAADPILRLMIVDTMVRDSQSRQEPGSGDRMPGLAGLPPGWLRDRIAALVHGSESRQPSDRAHPTAQVDAAWELALCLIELNNEVSIAAARVLLNEEWPGAPALRERVLGLLARPGLSPDTASDLRRRVGIADLDNVE